MALGKPLAAVAHNWCIMATDGCGSEGPASFRPRRGLDHAAAMIVVAPGSRLNVGVDHYGIGQASRHQENIARGSLRGRMALASACVSQSQLV